MFLLNERNIKKYLSLEISKKDISIADICRKTDLNYRTVIKMLDDNSDDTMTIHFMCMCAKLCKLDSNFIFLCNDDLFSQLLKTGKKNRNCKMKRSTHIYNFETILKRLRNGSKYMKINANSLRYRIGTGASKSENVFVGDGKRLTIKLFNDIFIKFSECGKPEFNQLNILGFDECYEVIYNLPNQQKASLIEMLS